MREVRVSTVNTQRADPVYSQEKSLALAKERIESIGRDRPDIIILAEHFANSASVATREDYKRVAQSVPGPISEELSALARKYRTYIAFGLARKDGEDVFNSLVLLDRDGRHVWTYDKSTPVTLETTACGVLPGREPASYQCDFGRVGGAICFDINFLELAEIYSRQDVELVLFSSMFPAGRLLDVWAIRYGFNIAGSTWYDRNRIIDCTGATVARTSDIMPYTTAVLNLNRCVLHMDGNLGKLDEIRTKYAGDVLVEDMRDEALCVLTSLKKGLEVHDLIRDYKLEKLYDYLNQAREMRSSCGGMGSLLV